MNASCRSSVVGGISVMFVLFSIGAAQTANTLSVYGPRPLAKAADDLELRYGMLITYEDPPYYYSGDYVDKAGPQHKQQGIKALLPREGRIEVNVAGLSEPRQAKDPYAVLIAVLKDHDERDNPGRFRIQEGNGIYQIVPEAVRDTSGKMQSVHPILDNLISLNPEERSLGETVSEICKELSRAAKVSVILGGAPNNMFAQYQSKVGVNNERAREVLSKALTETHHNMVWRLYYDSTGKWILNIKIPMMQVTNIRGGMELREIPFRGRTK